MPPSAIHCDFSVATRLSCPFSVFQKPLHHIRQEMECHSLVCSAIWNKSRMVFPILRWEAQTIGVVVGVTSSEAFLGILRQCATGLNCWVVRGMKMQTAVPCDEGGGCGQADVKYASVIRENKGATLLWCLANEGLQPFWGCWPPWGQGPRGLRISSESRCVRVSGRVREGIELQLWKWTHQRNICLLRSGNFKKKKNLPHIIRSSWERQISIFTDLILGLRCLNVCHAFQILTYYHCHILYPRDVRIF